MDALRARQPGSDGGKNTRRFEKVALPEDLATLDSGSRMQLRKILLDLLVTKTRSPAMSESMVSSGLALAIALCRDEGKHALANAIPTDYKTMLSVLEFFGIHWDTEVYYVQCLCGFIYRNCTRGDYSKATACPDCKIVR